MRGLIAAALCGLLLAPPAHAITEAELEAVKREAEYAKAKADIAEQQAREAKAIAERTKFDKGVPKPAAGAGAAPAPVDPKAPAAAATAAKPVIDPKAATAAPKPPADAKKAATK